MRRFFSQIRFAVFQNLWLENAVQISPLYFDFQHFKIRLLGSRCAARFKQRTQTALYRFQLMIPQFLYSSTFISEEADLVCRVKYGVSITSVSWEHTGWNSARRSAGRGGGICSGEWNCTGAENVGRWKHFWKTPQTYRPHKFSMRTTWRKRLFAGKRSANRIFNRLYAQSFFLRFMLCASFSQKTEADEKNYIPHVW